MPVSISNRQVQRLARQLGDAAKNAPKELARATVSIGRAAKTESKREAVKVYGLSQSRVAKDLVVRTGNLRVTIQASNKPISVKSYGARRTNRGLSFKVLKSGKRVVLRRGFISKEKLITLQRVGKSRFPVKGIYGPSVADMLAKKEVQGPLTRRLADRAVKQIIQRIGRLRG